MKRLESGRGFRYARDRPDGAAAMECLPSEPAGRRFHRFGDLGLEKRIRARIAEIERARSRDRCGA